MTYSQQNLWKHFLSILDNKRNLLNSSWFSPALKMNDTFVLCLIFIHEIVEEWVKLGLDFNLRMVNTCSWSKIQLRVNDDLISSKLINNFLKCFEKPNLVSLALKVDEWHFYLCLIFFHKLVEECLEFDFDFWNFIFGFNFWVASFFWKCLILKEKNTCI